jgi:hypothetical protein
MEVIDRMGLALGAGQTNARTRTQKTEKQPMMVRLTQLSHQGCLPVFDLNRSYAFARPLGFRKP